MTCAVSLVRTLDGEAGSHLAIDFAPGGTLPLAEFVDRQDDLYNLILQRAAQGFDACLSVSQPFLVGIMEIRADAFEFVPLLGSEPSESNHRNI